jgi:hypothetical protein
MTTRRSFFYYESINNYKRRAAVIGALEKRFKAHFQFIAVHHASKYNINRSLQQCVGKICGCYKKHSREEFHHKRHCFMLQRYLVRVHKSERVYNKDARFYRLSAEQVNNIHISLANPSNTEPEIAEEYESGEDDIDSDASEEY